LVVAGTASGQVGLETTYPYTGTITGTSVRVRAGRGDPSGANNYYYCAVLNRPAKVTVVGGAKGWLMVEPPEGCYSVVLQSAVKLDATGTKGTLTKREWARAAGTARTLQFTAGQKMLKSGDTVEILGTVVDRFKFYKIKSPAKVYFWIYAAYVEKVGAAGTATTTTTGNTAPTTRPAGVAPTTQPAGTAAVVAPKSTGSSIVGVSAAEMKDFRGVQAALRTEYGKPVTERDYTGLIARFKALKFKAGHPLVPFVNYYVKYIEGDIERLESIVAARKLGDDAAKAQKEFAAARAKVTVDVPTKPVTFDAEGIIAESRMFAGTSAVRKRYIVYDRKTHRLNAYIYATDPQVDLSNLVGKHIGVFGDSKYDKGLGANIIDVKQTEIIDDKAGAPLLGQPTIRTKPKVTVKPTTRPRPVTGGGTGPIVKPMPLVDLVPTTKPAGLKKPAPVITPAKPKPVPIIKPAPIPTAKPKSVGMLDPVAKPVVDKPKAVTVPKPVAVDVAGPKPVVSVRPKSVTVAKPKPVAVAKPKPATVLKPRPVDVVRPRPAPVVRPRPIDPARPIPSPVAKPRPTKAIGPIPVPVAKPKPVDVAKPIVSPKARPLPTTRAALAPTTRPSKLIDLESITRRLRPTTRPAATSIDAIPAPAKPVAPGDFPMPLPPSGLPLVDVKKTPTTMPANESEFD
jgi:hypothetical protein